MEVNNFKLVYQTPLLNFVSEDDFYFLQLLQRKKENPSVGRNSRVIKNYYITSVDHLKLREGEIIDLCRKTGARAMLRLNKRSFHKVAFRALQNIANTMSSKDFKHIKSQYDKACGETHNDSSKTWIIDIDEDNMFLDSAIEDMIDVITLLQPVGKKIVARVPSKSGLHLITRPFNLQEFQKKSWPVSIHKDNPTNLFIPDM